MKNADKDKDIQQFIASLCVEENISENTKRDILKFYGSKKFMKVALRMKEKNRQNKRRISSVPTGKKTYAGKMRTVCTDIQQNAKEFG